MKNGAELLDRLMKDIVADAAATYVSVYHEDEPNKAKTATADGAPAAGDEQSTKDVEAQSSSIRQTEADRSTTHTYDQGTEDRRAFSLERFIPLLTERVYAISPYTRMHLVSWLMVLNTVPDLELVSYLPEFLDGLL